MSSCLTHLAGLLSGSDICIWIKYPLILFNKILTIEKAD